MSRDAQPRLVMQYVAPELVQIPNGHLGRYVTVRGPGTDFFYRISKLAFLSVHHLPQSLSSPVFLLYVTKWMWPNILIVYSRLYILQLKSNMFFVLQVLETSTGCLIQTESMRIQLQESALYDGILVTITLQLCNASPSESVRTANQPPSRLNLVENVIQNVAMRMKINRVNFGKDSLCPTYQCCQSLKPGPR